MPGPDQGGASAKNERSPLGMNLSWVNHYATELPFVDGFKSASAWVPKSLDLDSNGWVRSLSAGQTAKVRMFLGIEGHYPAGDYVCLYDGEGVLKWELDASLKQRSPGREVVRVTPTDAGVLCRIVSTNPANHLRNIRFVMPGFEATYATDPWRPGFLSRWEKFKVLRFMDWQRTNHSPLGKWRDRTTPTRYSQYAETGVALEYMIDLCNRTGADPWFCIPHLADDDFVRRFATMVFQNLGRSKKVYLEYSNETWNGHFAQEAHVRQKGLDLRLDPSSSKNARNLYHAQRITEIGAIFESVFGGTDRLVRVLATQSVNSSMTREMLAHVVGSKRVSDNIDAVAVAPYVGVGAPGDGSATANKSVTRILGELHGNISALEHHVRKQVDAIGNLPIDLIAYEGGQGLRGTTDAAKNNNALTARLIAVNRDPGMESFYNSYLAAWRNAGGKLFLPFTSTFQPGKSGSWGALEYYDSDERATGKYSAMIKFIDNNSIWW